MTNFFAMGGYAVFVWPAYSASILVLAIAIIVSVKARARARGAVRRLEAEAGRNGEASK